MNYVSKLTQSKCDRLVHDSDCVSKDALTTGLGFMLPGSAYLNLARSPGKWLSCLPSKACMKMSVHTYRVYYVFLSLSLSFEPLRKKKQQSLGFPTRVKHKPAYAAKEDGQKLEISDLRRRGIVTFVLSM